MLLIRNSWGTAWADAGHFWMPIPYASNPSIGGDCWTGRRYATATGLVLPPKHITPTLGQIAAATNAARKTLNANGAHWIDDSMCVKIGNATAWAVANSTGIII
jgi:C1A family cysteine protease